ncbi:lethal giant larvae like, C-terminal-domain-containing protein [Melanogaster broomeanus]|nr:lethal giant larvae like, C-terminal-domain-containing protein [Melanogaster broomeanus]
MFSIRAAKHVFPDLSLDVRDVDDWDTGVLRTFVYLLDASVVAVDPLTSLLAIGSSHGTIRVFGAPGVDVTLDLPEPLRVQFLQFSVSTGQILSVDERNRLHIWDLTQVGHPRLQKTVSFEYVHHSALSLSPAHTHLFIALQTGEIRTYDLLCLRASPYVIPNLWKSYCQRMSQAGMEIPSTPASEILVDIVPHTRDLNLIILVFGGGVVQCDLARRDITCTYELLIPAGAPGGGGLESHDLLTHRQPLATSIAVHPAGHFFAVGHMDGCIAFWAIEDGDRPLLVMTLTDTDVNVVDGLKIQHRLENTSGKFSSSDTREPIYKLVWCGFPNSTDPRGGETALLVLGGGLSGNDPGLMALLMPAFDSPSPPTDASGLHSTVRDAMRRSLMPKKTVFYPSSSVVRDFFVIPRDSPYFSGAWDPVGVIWICGPPDMPGVEAYHFPPPHFFSAEPPPTPDQHGSRDVESYLSSALEEMKIDQVPRRLVLPVPIVSTCDGVTGAFIVPIQREANDKLLTSSTRQDSLPLNGGCAWIDAAKLSQAKLAKYHPHQILITTHRNARVHFHDISPQLLISTETSPVTKDLPQPLHALTINLNTVFQDPGLCDPPQESFGFPEICSVQLAPESLECLVTLKTGAAIYRLRFEEDGDATPQKASDKEIILLSHLPKEEGRQFHPYMMLRPGMRTTTASSLCDIGFFAVGYNDGSLTIVDLRGPSILRPAQERKKQFQLGRRSSSSLDPVISLTWAISGLAADLEMAIRLIAIHASGTTHIYKIARSQGSAAFSIASIVTTETLPGQLPRCSYVLDSQTGALLRANGAGLAASLQSPGARANGCVWVTVGATGARCTADITGDRVGKVDWNRKRQVLNAQIIERNSSRALVTFTEKSEAVVYSIPYLELLHTIPLPVRLKGPISVDETGDLLYCDEITGSGVAAKLTLATMYKGRRVYDDLLIDFMSSAVSIPPQPQPVSVGPPSLLDSWFNPPKSLTGEQLDTLLAGPNRPNPKQEATSHPRDVEATDTPNDAAGVWSNIEKTRSDLYSRLSAAVAERGEMLGDLEQRLDSIGQGSRDMVTQAKRLAAEQGAKNWFGF